MLSLCICEVPCEELLSWYAFDGGISEVMFPQINETLQSGLQSGPACPAAKLPLLLYLLSLTALFYPQNAQSPIELLCLC